MIVTLKAISCALVSIIYMVELKSLSRGVTKTSIRFIEGGDCEGGSSNCESGEGGDGNGWNGEGEGGDDGSSEGVGG